MKLSSIITTINLKRHLFIVLAGASVTWLMMYFIIDRSDDATIPAINTVTFCVFGVIMSYVLLFISKRLDVLFPWHTHLSYRFILGLFIKYGLLLGGFYLGMIAYNTIIVNEVPANDNSSSFIKLSIILFIVILIYNIIYFVLFSYNSYAKHQLESLTYQRKQIDLQFKALKAQLSPHFLFNSLNTISSLIHKNPHTADIYIRNLGKMYDYTLESYYSKVVTIKEELLFLNAYLNLILTRYEHRFNCHIDLPEAIMHHKIPPLTLQMLVENAVKHNQMHVEQPLVVNIFFENNKIVVANNITESPNKVSSFNIGLKNIKERFALLGNTTVSVSKDVSFTVKIPLL